MPRFFRLNFQLGSFRDDVMTGGRGRDWMVGRSGNDVMDGGKGRDFMYGGVGHDTLIGGEGADKLFGGSGIDTASYAGGVDDYSLISLRDNGRGPIKAKVMDADGKVDVLRGVEQLYFQADDYTAFLDGRNNDVMARDDVAASDATGTLLTGLVDNDFDFDGDTLSIASIDTTGLTGSATLNSDGTISYTTDGAFDSLAEGETATTTLTYTVTDGKGSTSTATVTITVTGENDAPELDVASAVTVDENTTAVTTAIASDIDAGDVVTLTLSGDDAALFQIDAAGVLTFIDAPDFETPADADGDGIYDVTVTATDIAGLEASQDIAVTVADVVELPPPYFNEFHYDNAGTDVGEFIEIAGPAGADYTGYSVVLYNGSNGTPYGNPIALGVLSDDGSDPTGYAVINLPTNGLQNGGPDGFALVGPGGTLIEFLSYEGTMQAATGPAAGMTSTDVGVSENGGTAVGSSIQRQDDGSWTAGDPESPGMGNAGAPPPPPPPVAELVISEIMQNPSAVSDTNGEYFELYNAGATDVDINGYVVRDDGTNTFTINNGGPLVIPAGGYLVLGNNADSAANGGVSVDYEYSGMALGNSDDEIIIIDTFDREVDRVEYDGGTAFPDPTGAAMELTDLAADNNDGANWTTATEAFGDGDLGTPGAANGADTTPLQINEIAVNTTGTDWEFIELTGAPGTSLDGMQLVQIRGNAGSEGVVYSVIDLDGQVIGENGFFLAASEQAESTFSVTGDMTFDNNEFVNDSATFALIRGDLSVADDLDADNSGALDSPLDVIDSVALSKGDDPVLYSDTVIGPDGSFLPAGAERGDNGDFRITSFGDPTDYSPTAGGDTGGGGGGGDPTFELLSAIQGTADASSFVGQTVEAEAVVTHIVSNGFYMQEEDSDADADAATSEGIFVFTGDSPDVSVTDVVYVTGAVAEFFGFTQIAASTVAVMGTADLPTAATLSLPFTMDATLEAVEGMRVSLVAEVDDAPLTVIENFELGRFGQIVVSEGIQINPTQIYDAQTQLAEINALQEANAANRIIIDDGESGSNPDSFNFIANTTAGDNGDGILSVGDVIDADTPTLRLGAQIDGAIDGVMGFGFGDYRLIPTETLSIDETTNSGARDGNAPFVGGDLTVVSFNALNYFTTLGSRGADTTAELTRQTEKLVNALEELDADIIGLQEVENNGFGADSATAALVDALNDRLGSTVYGFVDPTDDGAPIGTDVITTGFIYKLDAVSVVASDFLVFDDGGQQRNRPAVAAAFEDNNGEVMTVAVNHFKSKGGSGTGDDADSGDGQGNFNAIRTAAAEQLTAWLATDPLGVDDPDVLIIGDLNAYSQEDPVQAIEAAGYDNLIEDIIGTEDAFSFVFDGQQGALDHALSTGSMTDQITGMVEWHINAQEPGLFGYNGSTDGAFYNGDDVFRASDHDPLVIGVSLTSVDVVG